MKEEFLHYLWRFRLLHYPLFTTKNEIIEVLNNGIYNTDAGPDFSQAKLKIGDKIWAGNIEIHLKASDWNKHQHQFDKAYNTTILHVVYQSDMDIQMENGEYPPCLELKGKFDEKRLEKYRDFLKSEKWIPCSGQLIEFPEMKFDALYTRLSIERLEEKSKDILIRLEKNKNDWEESFYQVLAGTFGLKINQEVFIQFAESLPLTKVIRQYSNLFQIESLMFGQSGILKDKYFTDEYPRKLQKEYAYLAKKHQLQALEGHLWKYLRLRPANFPNIRIAQFAALIFSRIGLFAQIVETEELTDLDAFFQIEASDYWTTHFVWDKQSLASRKKISRDRIHLILINAVVPFLFLYSKLRQREELVDRSLEFLENIPFERNKTTKNFLAEGLKLKSAIQSQALIQLKNKYCDAKRCLNCPIGVYLLR